MILLDDFLPSRSVAVNTATDEGIDGLDIVQSALPWGVTPGPIPLTAKDLYEKARTEVRFEPGQTPPRSGLCQNRGRVHVFRLHCSRGGKVRGGDDKRERSGQTAPKSPSFPNWHYGTTKALVNAPDYAMGPSLKVVQVCTGRLEFSPVAPRRDELSSTTHAPPKSYAVDRSRRSTGANRAQFAVPKYSTSTTNSVFCAVELGTSDARHRFCADLARCRLLSSSR